MKIIVTGLLLALCYSSGLAQSKIAPDQVIEGGKVVVELIKAFQSKKDSEKNPGCKGKYADLCIVNESHVSITAIINHRLLNEKRELIILPLLHECSLQIATGIWTYDLRVTGTAQPIRKGDLLVEACQNLTMNIKY